MILDHVNPVVEIERLVYPTPWSKNAFISEVLENGFAAYFVALDGEKVIGYAGIWTILDEAHITTLAVDPYYQGRGIGSILLKRIMHEAQERGATRMTLEVRSSNEKAQNLYRQYGFETRGVRTNYYRDEDALIMWLDKIAGPRQKSVER